MDFSLIKQSQIVGAAVSLANSIVLGLWIVAAAGFVLLIVGIFLGIWRDTLRKKRPGD